MKKLTTIGPKGGSRQSDSPPSSYALLICAGDNDVEADASRLPAEKEMVTSSACVRSCCLQHFDDDSPTAGFFAMERSAMGFQGEIKLAHRHSYYFFLHMKLYNIPPRWAPPASPMLACGRRRHTICKLKQRMNCKVPKTLSTRSMTTSFSSFDG